MAHRNKGVYEGFLKRLVDIILSSMAIILLSVPFVIVSIMVRKKLGSPILFKQERPGLYGRPFFMYKFRTMTDDKDEKGALLPDHLRLTKFGTFLRATSLDELPELFNIIKGDMSIVGPRPLLMGYLPLYNSHQKRRHEVKPGLTGLAQVNGRNAISWEEKFDLDVHYVDNVSISKDIKIILTTIKKVFIREGINSEEAATVEPFRGNKKDVDNE
ncbi:Sugar transferase involved in LPS biosynthesis (colanic, teichoic acid) [Halobacillus karajensis]|uniref:sugar transferase n=1 Tax=Halobacillus karajensis TaxID=195088 RepID=UPI0008A731EC|nr:sugar transferase [Halobacillus karajensis]SEH44060.1 Sugar transferase involved in LPS biosynthesis (colanic, teichoic acid) [Halobacillus karajensis]